MTSSPGNLPEFFSSENYGLITKDVSFNQVGRIKYRASFWPAKPYHPSPNVVFRQGQTVTVVGRIGLTLLVAQSPTEEIFHT